MFGVRLPFFSQNPLRLLLLLLLLLLLFFMADERFVVVSDEV